MKMFLFSSIRRLFNLVFTLNIHGKNVRMIFFWCLYRSNGTKIHLDVDRTVFGAGQC